MIKPDRQKQNNVNIIIMLIETTKPHKSHRRPTTPINNDFDPSNIVAHLDAGHLNDADYHTEQSDCAAEYFDD